MKIRSVFACIVGVLFFTSVYPTRGVANPCEEGECLEYLVKFSEGVSPEHRERILKDNHLVIADHFEMSAIYHVVQDPAHRDPKLLERLNRYSEILYAEPNYWIESNYVPDDPQFSELWALQNTGQFGGIPGIDLGMNEVWDFIEDSASIVVAMVDSGVDYTHEDLQEAVWVNKKETPANGIDDDQNGYVDDVHGYDFFNEDGDPADDYFHGTHVAGIIGAVGDNGVGITGITGINEKIKLMALKFMDSAGKGPVSDAVRAIEYAVKNGAKIINNSWSFTYPGLTGLPDPSAEPVQSLRDAIVAADAAGVIFVAAAGNTADDSDQIPAYPASYSLANIISVTATDNKDALANFSSYGAVTIDMGAPGVNIYSTYPNWKMNPPYHYMSGTSMACPQVSGAAAVLWADNPSLSHHDVIDYLLDGVQPASALEGKTVTGGRLDLAESLALVGSKPHSEPANEAPVANAGPDQARKTGDTVLLQGKGSDANGDNLIYTWSLLSTTSQAILINATSATASFVADVAGTYTATLIVSDGKSSSVADQAVIYVSTATSTSAAVSMETDAASTAGSGSCSLSPDW